ncbi:MAG: transposase [Kiritimatiellia bacterium]
MRESRAIENRRCCHLISRLAHQAFFLDDEEKTRAVELLRRVEEFSGVVVLAYAILSNHFHIFIYVPEPGEIGDDEILRRIRALYRDASFSRVLGEWTRLEGRYHERNHGPERPVMWRTSAYIDINVWEAGVVERPEDYEWCSFAAAVRGDEKARRGYAFMYRDADDWNVIRECHEKSMREAMGEILAARAAEKDAERILRMLGDGPMRPSAIRKAIGMRHSTHFNRHYLVPLLSKGLIERTDPAHPQSPQQKYKLS